MLVHYESILPHHKIKIHPTAVIGTEGFGFEKDKAENFIYPLKRNQHAFHIWIGEGVEIGAFCVIDRGSWRDTILHEGTKLDSCVKVAHNVRIGKNNLLVHGTVIGGSCTIGDNNFFGINCSVKQHLTIGSNCVIGMGAVVIHDIPDNTTVVGNPAKTKEPAPSWETYQTGWKNVKTIHDVKGFAE